MLPLLYDGPIGHEALVAAPIQVLVEGYGVLGPVGEPGKARDLLVVRQRSGEGIQDRAEQVG